MECGDKWMMSGKKVTIPTKVWKDRDGGRGYRYETKRATRYIFMVRRVCPECHTFLLTTEVCGD